MPASEIALRSGDLRACVVFIGVFLAFERSAKWLGSLRGEHGLLVVLIVVGLLVVLERPRGGRTRDTLRTLGCRAARPVAFVMAVLLSAALIGGLPAIASVLDMRLAMRDGWLSLAIGMVLQGGIAEEVLFRGYLFERVRRGRSFGRAAVFAAVPFTAVHTLLFVSLEVMVAGAALALALAISFPLAWLFERAGRSIWPGALLHASIQAPIKLVETSDAQAFGIVATIWMGLCATLPWLVFLLRPAPGEDAAGPAVPAGPLR